MMISVEQEKLLNESYKEIFLKYSETELKGFFQEKIRENVYHLPLAANTERLRKITLTTEEVKRYSAPFSFVGKLYESPLGEYMTLMDDYCKGYRRFLMQLRRQ